MFDVITIGSTTRDAFFESDFTTIKWPKTPSRLAYVLPKGDKLEIKRAYFTVGGNAANGSVTFARQGFRVAAVGKIGDDASGEEIKRKLASEKVNTSLMAMARNMPSAHSVLLLENAERTILGYHGSSDTFAIRDLHLLKMKAKWWYMSLAGESDKMFLPLIKFARANKIAVAFNPSGHHLRHKRNDVLRSLKDISFLVLNDEEAGQITGIPWKYEKKVFKKLDKLMSPGILAVTTGRMGVTVSDGKYVYKAGIFKERKLVDRTGAGDAFGSGFTAGLLLRGINAKNIGKAKSSDICYAIRLATANATSVVEKIGATEGIITREEFNMPRWKNLNITVKKI
ncbi:MAG: carbohydrate kinase family protein [Patescibacteria group bacterium]|nr:carbohydrate kinase family protein [Patescibacteria group bacterium]MDE2015419.1 carbohydrate kinase family protein [Patescibacteria group bacterium]MDE2226966.1 carbohydrate kinase family protein [Patescibacteria group bacterium]